MAKKTVAKKGKASAKKAVVKKVAVKKPAAKVVKVVKKPVAKVVKKPVAKKTANASFMKPMQISADLAVVVGKGPMPRSDVVKKLWAYIRKQGLQDQKNKRNINADENLKKVFGGKATVSMFEMTKLVAAHLS